MTEKTPLSEKIFTPCLNEECLPIIREKYLFFAQDVRASIQNILEKIDEKGSEWSLNVDEVNDIKEIIKSEVGTILDNKKDEGIEAKFYCYDCQKFDTEPHFHSPKENKNTQEDSEKMTSLEQKQKGTGSLADTNNKKEVGGKNE